MELMKDTIKKLRKEKGLNQTQVAEMLGITQGAYRKYESGEAEPSCANLSKLADLYGVTVDHIMGRATKGELTDEDVYKIMGIDIEDKTPTEIFMSLYDEMSEETQDLFYQLILRINDINTNEIKGINANGDPVIMIPTMWLPTSDFGAAASSYDDVGVSLDGYNSWEKREYNISNYRTRHDWNNCFVIRVVGESMLPEYEDGDHLLVKGDLSVDDGDIGLFVVDGEGFVKQLRGSVLHSLNEGYPDIYGDFTVAGKVLGTIEPIIRETAAT